MSPERPPTAALTDAAHRSSASFELVLGPVLMALIGLLIDSRVGTRPWFTVAFAVWGLAGAGVLVYYRYRQQMEVTSGGRTSGTPTESSRRVTP
jgi:F0F1-type ATP synthase assembly protein I